MLAEALRGELAGLEELVERQLETVEALGVEPPGCVAAIGAGDSYAAALAAQGVAGGRVVALDPLEALSSGVLASLASRGCGVLALSVGGRTRVVVEAAAEAARRGAWVAAVTGDPGSPLASQARVVIPLVYGGLAAGVGAARHVAMLAALAGLYGYRGGLPGSWRLPGCGWLMGPEVHAGTLEAGGSSLYAALKLYEVFGSSVRWWPLEQLVHAPVYAAGSVAVYEPALDPGGRTWEVLEALREAGLRVERVPRLDGDPWGNALAQAAAVLGCLLEAVERLGVEEPAYRRHRGLRPLTRLIYMGVG